MFLGRRRYLIVLVSFAAIFALLHRGFLSNSGDIPRFLADDTGTTPDFGSSGPDYDPEFFWSNIKHNYPLKGFRSIPKQPRGRLGRVQAKKFPKEEAEQKKTRLARQRKVRDSFERCWEAYKEHAWLHDDLAPVSGGVKDGFGGWGATLIDSLDTLLIMGFDDEFLQAVDSIHNKITFRTTQLQEINVFETTIRFLGGMLSAYDIGADPRILAKARRVGDLIYKAFDTPNHLPVARWDLHAAEKGEPQTASTNILIAELGSLSMEMTRLSLVTGQPKYYDAVQHISELLAASQDTTRVPGMWPITVNAATEDFDVGMDYGLGGMADSMYEYLPKMMALLGDGNGIYREMYLKSAEAAIEHLLFRPMLPDNDDVLFAGDIRLEMDTSGAPHEMFSPVAQHLACFAGGMFALGGRLVLNQTHVDIGAKLTKGCVWAYDAMKTGVMPEVFSLVPCQVEDACEWNDEAWHQAIRAKIPAASDDKKLPIEDIIAKRRLPRGMTKISAPGYLLRPEAIESVFIMYRVTGDKYWQEAAWRMFESIEALTRTQLANAAVKDVNVDPDKGAVEMVDSMESFWMGETLKYFYLIFSHPDIVNLDEWVLNTEAHPFRRMT